MIGQNNARRVEFERTLERFAPTKVRLIQANALTCATCIARGSVALTCPGGCNGTGYTGMPRIQNSTDWLNAPASTTYLIHADVLDGKGLYGQGGDYIKLIPDLGKLDIGDGTAFVKFQEFDRRANKFVSPREEDNAPRPDRIIDRFGTIWTVHKVQPANLGDDVICKILTLLKGLQDGT